MKRSKIGISYYIHKKRGGKMSIYKRCSVWWADFTIQGTRYRKSLDVTTEREAKKLERAEIEKANQGLLLGKITDVGRLDFGPALDEYLHERHSGFGRRKSLAPNTVRTERERSAPVKKHIGSIPVKKIQAETVHQYIATRKQAGASNGTINRELDLIRGVLKKAKRWAFMSDSVKGLPPGQTIGRAFTADEKLRLITAAKGNAAWQNARLALTLALNTSMRPCEIKSLQWRDVDWLDRVISLRVSKTAAGVRTIPLNTEAYAAVLELRQRACLLFGDDLAPEWHLFYGTENGGFDESTGTYSRPDPSRPVRHWRRAWRSIMKAAGVHKARFYDSRHTAVTDLLQNPGVSEEVAKAIVGHVSRKMLERYSHQRMEAKRKAVAAISRTSSVETEYSASKDEQLTAPAAN